MSARLLSRFVVSKSGALSGLRLSRPATLGGAARKLSCVPVDDLISGLTDEQIEVR